jgi:hypothetical protein
MTKAAGIFLSLLLLSATAGAWGVMEEQEDRFEYAGIDTLRVENASIFSIEIAGINTDRVTGEIVNPSENRLVVTHNRLGSTLTVRVERRRTFFGSFSGEHRLIFKVPKRIELDLESSTGSIEIDDCRGRKRLHTSTGSVTVRGSAGDINSHSSTGRQMFENTEGDIRADSSTGSISLRDVKGSLDLHSSTGTHEGWGITITGDSSFRTSTGSIRLDFENDLSDFTFDLDTSTGRLRVGETEARKTLQFGNGRIRIHGRSSTGSQTYE